LVLEETAQVSGYIGLIARGPNTRDVLVGSTAEPAAETTSRPKRLTSTSSRPSWQRVLAATAEDVYESVI
jgi:hypothetical protein